MYYTNISPKNGPIKQPVKAKFLDGPLADMIIIVPRGADYVRVGPWIYSYAGKENRVPMYCRLPKSRQARRVLKYIIGKAGGDPRVQRAKMLTTPVKRTGPPAKGRGARRRMERRANVQE